MIERDLFLKTVRRLNKLRLRTLCKLLYGKEGMPSFITEAEASFLWLAQHLDSWCPLSQEHVAVILDHFKDALLELGKTIAAAVAYADKSLPVAHLAVGDRRYCAVTGAKDFLDLNDGEIVKAVESSFAEITLYNLTMIYVRNLGRLTKLKQEAPVCPST